MKSEAEVRYLIGSSTFEKLSTQLSGRFHPTNRFLSNAYRQGSQSNSFIILESTVIIGLKDNSRLF